MTQTHTKGHWKIEEPMDHEIWIVEAGKQSYEWRVIAGLPWPDEKGDIPKTQVQGNARLIVAACNSYDKHCGPNAIACAEGDLLGEALAALKRSREGWSNAIDLGLIPPQHRNTARILADEAAAVLLKAKGEA